MSASKRKGTAWETSCVKYLQQFWPSAERRALAGTNDKGDITGLGPLFVIECKDAKRHELAQWMDETEVERVNATAQFGIIFLKRRMKPVNKGYALVPIEQMAELMRGYDAA